MIVPEGVAPISRREAYEKDMRQYWTGKLCAHGHRSYRYVSTSGCIQCLRDASQKVRVHMRGFVSLGPHINQRVHREDLPAIEAYATQLFQARKRAQETALLTTPMPDGFTLHPAVLARLASPPPTGRIDDCGLCGHPTQWGQACQVCGTVMAPTIG